MDERWKKIAVLDLKSVKAKFAFRKSWWWHLGHSAARVESEYRQFLFLVMTNPEKTVVPWSRDLDDFWHQHILDTAKYARDCQSIFGGFIHHDPHLPEQSSSYNTAFAETHKMYKKTFGEDFRRENGCGDAPYIFSEGGPSHGHHGSGHHGGGHGGHGHGCGGHGGHGCGGHGGH